MTSTLITHTWVINLLRRPDKKKLMENEFAKLLANGSDLKPNFFEAVDGKTDLSRFKFKVANWFDPNTGKAMTLGEIGCAISHQIIWQTIVSNVELKIYPKDCLVLILEDDVVFVDDFEKKLFEYTNNELVDFDMLYLHRKPLDFNNEKQLTPTINIPNKSYWACAYILTLNGAKKLLQVDYLNNLIPVDEFLPAMYGIPIFGSKEEEKEKEKSMILDKIKCLAVNPSLLKLTDDAFEQSETYHSDPFNFDLLNSNLITNNFLIILYNYRQNDCYDRFRLYCSIYGLTVILYDSQKQDFESKIRSNQIVMFIDGSDLAIFPISAPNEIIEKAFALMKNENDVIVPLSTKTTKTTIWLCSGNKFIEIFKNDNFVLDNQTIIIDVECEIFQLIEVDRNEIVFLHKKSRVQNRITKTMPCFVYSNNTSADRKLNQIENYTGNGWNKFYGSSVKEIEFTNLNLLPKIYFSFSFLMPNPDNHHIIDYPLDRLVFGQFDLTNNETVIRDLENFLETDCDYYFVVDVGVIITNPKILQDLLKLNRSVVGPMLRKGKDLWTNFWGDLGPDGFYSRSFDYIDIVERKKIGCWNVPYIGSCYLVKREVFETIPNLYTKNNQLDIDMCFCQNLREHRIFMYVSNLKIYGYLVESESPIRDSTCRLTDKVESESLIEGPTCCLTDTVEPVQLTSIFDSRDQWEAKYLHPLYHQHLLNLKNLSYDEVCPDIYTFPLFSEDFCVELIEMAEAYGKWSKGHDKHEDLRLGVGYYENVPTVDIQLFEINLEKQWKEIVFTYVAPLVHILYSNYKTKDINLAFVVKYEFGNQSSLSPHHDSSTYTINIALNWGDGIDYSGGGCHFIRQKYTLQNQKIGYAAIHPGRLTAYHEGLPVTAGTRYILVSFIN